MKKAELKSKFQSLEETEKTLVVRMRLLQEKLTIQMLEQRIKAKLASVEELKSKIRELEKKLEGTQKKKPMNVMVKVAPQ
ncbi:MAG: hypothetical protein OEZ35_08225 [Candidatus Bathyarchaeota archaeon]|nr:hypothetical protein [Candidatus Bathyarchaeota archaeon]